MNDFYVSTLVLRKFERNGRARNGRTVNFLKIFNEINSKSFHGVWQERQDLNL